MTTMGDSDRVGARLIDGVWCILCVRWEVDQDGKSIEGAVERTYMPGAVAAALLNANDVRAVRGGWPVVNRNGENAS